MVCGFVGCAVAVPGYVTAARQQIHKESDALDMTATIRHG
jgi:hypothetical protein